MPSSSCSSRLSACTGVSGDSILPPGSSHHPAQGLSAGRCASSNWPWGVCINPTATSSSGLDMLGSPVLGKLTGNPAGAGATFQGPLQGRLFRCLNVRIIAAMLVKPVRHNVQIIPLSEWIKGEPNAKAFREGNFFFHGFARMNFGIRSEEHTSELQSRGHLVCRLLLEKKNTLIDRSSNIH